MINNEVSKKSYKLETAILLSSISFWVCFFTFFKMVYGVYFDVKIFDYPFLLISQLFEALGGAFVLPAINVLLMSAFKKFRNSSSRQTVFIVWAIIIIFSNIFNAMNNY